MTPEQQALLRRRRELEAEGHPAPRRVMMEEFGLSLKALAKRLERAYRAERRTMAGDDAGMDLARQAVKTSMMPSLAWLKTSPDEEGRSYSVMLRPQPMAEDAAERIKDLFSSLPAAKPCPPPLQTEADLLALIPAADIHSGMKAWAKETGEAYDTDIAMERLVRWTGQVVRAMPAAGVCVLLYNGDTFHADNDAAVTPTNKHPLDVDSRHFRTADLTIAGVAICAEQAAQRFGHVLIVVRPGNHDPISYFILIFALRERFRFDKRIHVDAHPAEHWCYLWGKVFLAAHHGHRQKPENLVLYLAHEHAQEWGAAKYRYLWTAHHHKLTSSDIGGVQWERTRAVTSRDAYAAANMFPARPELQGVTYHRNLGEIARVRVAA